MSRKNIHISGEKTQFSKENQPVIKRGKDVVTQWLRELGDETITSSSGTKASRAEVLARRGLELAIKGDFRYWNAITERLEGKVAQQIKHTGNDDGPIRIDYSKMSEDELDAIIAGAAAGGGGEGEAPEGAD